MTRQRRYPFGLLFLCLSLVAVSSAPADLPPAFLLTWGWGVQDGSAAFQVCRSGCQEGIYGGGVGQLANPKGVAIDAAGNIYVADSNNDRIQKFDRDGPFLASWGSTGTGEGQFRNPIGVTLDAVGNVYVSDKINHRIQKFDNTGNFLLTWGWGVQNGAAALQTCATGCQAGLPGGNVGQLDDPTALAVDISGAIYVADTDNHRIQRFENTGEFLDLWGSLGSADEQFRYPQGIAIDNQDRVYIADT
jgi:DNA-binding beta-propeller fold protein YncE